MPKTFFQLKSDSTVKQYGKLYFEHLSADYRVFEVNITNEADKELLEKILKKSENNRLTWEDIQVFDLTLLKHLDFAAIKGKVFALRERYTSLLNPSELERYKNLKKIDLDNASDADSEKLREEYSLLVRDFCLRYMFIDGRERLRSKLLRNGAIMMLFFFIIVAVIGTIANYQQTSSEEIIPVGTSGDSAGEPAQTVNKKQTPGAVAGSLLYGYATIAIVVFAGITGAFVSMQQRIQSFEYGGDPVMDLSMMTHGWLSIFLSPLSGAIFAVILYLFFAGNLLSGVIFPEFVVSPYLGSLTIKAKQEPDNESTSEPSNTTQSNTNNQANAGNQANANNQTNSNSQSNANSNINVNSNAVNQENSSSSESNATDYTETEQNIPMQINYFIKTTGPKQGKDFALLLIWCFIAGFAERFVPDALMRLVDQKKKAESV